jgi:hypothetical protein
MNLLNRSLELWLPSFIMQSAQRARLRRFRAKNLVHVIVTVCDHFEPRHKIANDAQADDRLAIWKQRYLELQKTCTTKWGTKPLHTWFYPPHHGLQYLSRLAEMCHLGLGEVELHLHHSGDTPESLRTKLNRVLQDYRQFGHLLQQGDPLGDKFGFIHGDWALNNSGHGKFCGVNDEISILRELGCWADLTMPSGNNCQTKKINSIYRALGDPLRPKGHDRGEDARVNEPGPANSLLMIQGPLGFNLSDLSRPRIENASITDDNHGRPDRIDTWVDYHIHVRDRPEWLFVKLHCHGALESDFSSILGDKALQMHESLASKLNDGKSYRLHYVTARESYNIIRAAEECATGDPSQYRDFEVGPPVTKRYWASGPHKVVKCNDSQLELSISQPESTSIHIASPNEICISGNISSLTVDYQTKVAHVVAHGAEQSTLYVSDNTGTLSRVASDGRVLLP